ncbi:unnamed protein product [Cunninghamella blakesleeana]
MSFEQNNTNNTLTTTLTTTNASSASTMVNNNDNLSKNDSVSVSSNQNMNQESILGGNNTDYINDNNDNNDHNNNNEEEEAKLKRKKENRRKLTKFLIEQFKEIGLTLFINVGLSLALYYATKGKVGEVNALIIGGIPPLLFVIFKFWQKRKLDIIGCIFVVAFIGSAVLSIITGDARIALFRDAVVDVLIALIFWVTLIPINTRWLKMEPLCYLITKQMLSAAPKIEWIETDEETGEEIIHSKPSVEWMWEEVTFFRRFCYILTFIWGLVMALDFAIKSVIILATKMSIDEIVNVNSILQIVITVTMTTGSIVASAFSHKKTAQRLKEFKATHKMIETPTENQEQEQQQ